MNDEMYEAALRTDTGGQALGMAHAISKLQGHEWRLGSDLRPIIEAILETGLPPGEWREISLASIGGVMLELQQDCIKEHQQRVRAERQLAETRAQLARIRDIVRVRTHDNDNSMGQGPYA